MGCTVAQAQLHEHEMMRLLSRLETRLSPILFAVLCFHAGTRQTRPSGASRKQVKVGTA